MISYDCHMISLCHDNRLFMTFRDYSIYYIYTIQILHTMLAACDAHRSQAKVLHSRSPSLSKTTSATSRPGKPRKGKGQVAANDPEIMPGPSFVFTCFSVHVTIQDPRKTVVGLRALGHGANNKFRYGQCTSEGALLQASPRNLGDASCCKQSTSLGHPGIRLR